MYLYRDHDKIPRRQNPPRQNPPRGKTPRDNMIIVNARVINDIMIQLKYMNILLI